jgi:hypothetical protein
MRSLPEKIYVPELQDYGNPNLHLRHVVNYQHRTIVAGPEMLNHLMTGWYPPGYGHLWTENSRN